jgi:hypothetical protein
MEGGMGTGQSGPAAEPTGCEIPIFVSNPTTRTFWMTPKRSSIVILNLIAKLQLALS